MLNLLQALVKLWSQYFGLSKSLPCQRRATLHLLLTNHQLRSQKRLWKANRSLLLLRELIDAFWISSLTSLHSYGEQQIVHRVSRETIDLDGPNNPIAVFIFKYRTRRMYQDNFASLLLTIAARGPQSRNDYPTFAISWASSQSIRTQKQQH